MCTGIDSFNKLAIGLWLLSFLLFGFLSDDPRVLCSHFSGVISPSLAAHLKQAVFHGKSRKLNLFPKHWEHYGRDVVCIETLKGLHPTDDLIEKRGLSRYHCTVQHFRPHRVRSTWRRHCELSIFYNRDFGLKILLIHDNFISRTGLLLIVVIQMNNNGTFVCTLAGCIFRPVSTY